MIDPKKLAEWRALCTDQMLCERASPGLSKLADLLHATYDDEEMKEATRERIKDAVHVLKPSVDLASAAREALPALLDEVERLRGLLREACQYVGHMYWCWTETGGQCNCRPGDIADRIDAALLPNR